MSNLKQTNHVLTLRFYISSILCIDCKSSRPEPMFFLSFMFKLTWPLLRFSCHSWLLLRWTFPVTGFSLAVLCIFSFLYKLYSYQNNFSLFICSLSVYPTTIQIPYRQEHFYSCSPLLSPQGSIPQGSTELVLNYTLLKECILMTRSNICSIKNRI